MDPTASPFAALVDMGMIGPDPSESLEALETEISGLRLVIVHISGP